MQLWSSVFLNGTVENETGDWATCVAPLPAWRKITEENDGQRLIAQIQVGEKIIFAALGTPVQGDENDRVYLPTWMIDQLGSEGIGETADISWLSQEAFPEATRIVLRPHDSAFYYADAKEELERALTRLGVLRQGDTVLIPLEVLGGYQIAFDVITTEPANIVLAQGDEVVIEFEAALDGAAEAQSGQPAPEPVPEASAPLAESAPFFPELIAPEPPPIPAGNVLGGTIRLNPDGTRWNPWRNA
jgi:hypothetical protein